jgi:UPF0271 protein
MDLNADLGEGFGRWSLGDDDALIEVITSANVACGFHAGDPMIMRRVCRAARERSVAVGAQFSYRDLAGFGRRPMQIPAEELTADIVYQIGGLDACARAEGTRVSYVKPHGALNNVSAVDDEQAAAIVAAVLAIDATLPVLALPGSKLEEHARAAGVPTIAEAYPDRAYEADGQLVNRSHPGAVLHDVDLITERAVQLAIGGRVLAQDGTEILIRAQSLCLHGDNPASVQAARSVADALRRNGVTLSGFTGPV